MSQIHVLIIEDEPPAAKRLKKLLEEIDPNINVVDIIDSVDTSIKYLTHNKKIDLLFMDIQLSDGLSFEIFTEIDVSIPVIFTTAFDNYMLNAFKVHSVDYILKPLEKSELKAAIEKFTTYYIENANTQNVDFNSILNQFLNKNFKERFLVKSGNEIKYINTNNISYFYSEDSYTHICTNENSKYIIDYKLDEIEKIVDPKQFFRINRQIIISISSIKKIESYFNSRFKISANPSFSKEIIVSRDRASDFKKWLDQ